MYIAPPTTHNNISIAFCFFVLMIMMMKDKINYSRTFSLSENSRYTFLILREENHELILSEKLFKPTFGRILFY